MLLYVHRNHNAYYGRGRGGGGRVNDSSASCDPQKNEEDVDHRQNNYVKAVRTSPERSNLCTSLIAVSTAVRSIVTITAQLLRNN